MEVEADLVADGHDVVRAALRYRHEDDEGWHEVALEPRGNDTWRAAFEPARLGRYLYTATGRIDPFATWRHGLERKVAAGVEGVGRAARGQVFELKRFVRTENQFEYFL